MSQILWIKNGRIIDPANNRDETGDLFAVNGKIVNSLNEDRKKEAEVIDASGMVVCPGLVDIHVHLREPGQTHKENIATGSRAAAAGGFTSVICMPNTSPPVDQVGTLQQIMDSIKRSAVVNVYPTGCITQGMNGEKLAPIGSLHKAGVVAITDDGKCVQNNQLMRKAVEYANMFNLPVMDHCQDYSLTEDAAMNEGKVALQLGLKGWPNAAEDIIVSRNIILSTYTGAQIHMQHISSANSVRHLRRAKKRGIRVTAEVSPHHISLTDEKVIGYNTNFKMNPPLRTEQDRMALIEGLLDGTIDCIATDHAPHTDYEKDVEFDYAPFGIIGMETALSVSLGALVEPGHCSINQVINWLTHAAAKTMKLDKGTLGVGADADITMFNPEEEWTVDPKKFQSRSANCPWNGQILKGKIRRTIVAGKTVWDGNQIIE